jgi:glutamate 5-kinase
VLDDGAVRAVRERGASLLAAGVTGVHGDFLADDPVELVGPDGGVVARGLVAYDARELPALLGRKTLELDPEHRREVVHRDEMVLVGRRPVG